MVGKPRKQTAKFFFKEDADSKHLGKMYMAIVISRAVYWSFNPDCPKKFDALVGDQENIQRLGRREWTQRNAFLFRGYLPNLDRARKRLSARIPMKIQNLTLPTQEEMIRQHVPISK